MPIELDNTDRRLLQRLQDDCALTNHDLARHAHISDATCLRRVRRLVESGIIERRVAIVSHEALGHGLTAILEVSLVLQTAEALADFETHAAAAPEVQQCYHVSAGIDFILIVHVRDMPAYHAFVHRALTAQANVRNVRSFFSVKRSKFAPRIEV
jgi:Lrp/AsnC family transcriptional regulator, leucine-responsive regulatory protein